MPSFRETLAIFALLAFIAGAGYLLSEIAIAGSWLNFLRQTFESASI